MQDVSLFNSDVNAQLDKSRLCSSVLCFFIGEPCNISYIHKTHKILWITSDRVIVLWRKVNKKNKKNFNKCMCSQSTRGQKLVARGNVQENPKAPRTFKICPSL